MNTDHCEYCDYRYVLVLPVLPVRRTRLSAGTGARRPVTPYAQKQNALNRLNHSENLSFQHSGYAPDPQDV